MHTPGHRWTTLLLMVVAASSVGCRGSRPFGNLVHVTRETDEGLPDVQSPPQRLATAKPRDEAAGGSRSRPADPASALTQTASSRTSAKPRADGKTGAAPPPSPATETGSTPSTQPAMASQAATAPLATTQSPSESGAESTAITANLSDLAGLDSQELLSMLNRLPPEAQSQAIRQFAALTARSADRTSQPNSPMQQLTRNISDLPELPTAKSNSGDDPPTRIAAQPSQEPAAVASLSDASPQNSDAADKPVQRGLTDLVTGELESTEVTTISDTAENDSSQVRQAAGSQGSSDDAKVALASLPAGASPAAAVPSPQSPPDQLSEQELFAALMSRYSKPVPGESEADRNSRWIRLRHLMVLSGDPDAAVEQIEGMAEVEQEFLRHQLLGLWTMIDPAGHPVPSRRFATALPQIREATKFAAAATDALEVRSLAFCTEIESYGQIKTFPGNRFDAGQQVILYCEIENFTVKKTDEGFETHLQGSYDIYNQDDHKVVSQLLPADQQVSANYLRDYFIAYQMHLPQQLTPGTYRMQLTMEDMHGKKYGQASVPLEIAKAK